VRFTRVWLFEHAQPRGWTRELRPQPGESGTEFADRVLDERYGSAKYTKGPRLSTRNQESERSMTVEKSKTKTKEVFVVHHSYESSGGFEEIKLIGLFSTSTSAESAIASLGNKPGFSSYPKHFSIEAYRID
jgi:hypothetical protein